MPKTVRPRRIVQPAAADAGFLTDIVAVAAPKECSRLIGATGSWRKEDRGRRTGFPTDLRLRERLPLRRLSLPPQVAISGSLPRRLAAEERTAPSGRQIGSRHTEVLRRTNKGLRNSKRRRLCHRYFRPP